MKRRGFTLLEVLVATAIFALMAALIAGSYVNILRAYQAVANNGVRDAQLTLAREQFLREADRKKAEEGADFSDGETRVEWKAEIEATQVPDLYRCVWSCTLRVPGAKADERVEETFWLLRPSWAEAAERGPIELKFREAIEKGLPDEWRKETPR